MSFSNINRGATCAAGTDLSEYSCLTVCVSDALIGYDKYHGVRERQDQTVKDLQESVDVSLIRYRGGTANYLDSQRWSFQAELTLAQARNNEYQSLVQLYSPEYIVNELWIGYRSRCLKDQEPAAVQNR
jgi:hypothetical protein